MHITSITVYYYHGSILFLVIVINLLLCLTYKLNFKTGMYMYRVRYYVQVQASPGGLGTHLRR